MTTSTRTTKRRAETRRRLIDAAFTQFAERGFGRTTVEDVCEAAGYTRGAFYSNFASLDELFSAVYDHLSHEVVTAVAAAATAAWEQPGPRPGVDEVVDAALAVMSADPRVMAVHYEFTAHALRHPEAAAAITAFRARTRRALASALRNVLGPGPTPAQLDTLARSLVAVHDGTQAQVVMEPGNPQLARWRRDLLVATLRGAALPEPPEQPAARSS
jgi:AcrR family transcriptional regulator